MSWEGEDGSGRDLDPWPVIVECLFELNSYEIPEIIGKSGMNVDWTLTEREDYSHKYRNAAYRPRINRSFKTLSRGSKLRVAYVISEELVRRDLGDKLNDALGRIGWSIAGGHITPANETVRELFFPQGSQHDAYVQIKEICRRATRSLRVIDPYLDGTIFTILGESPKALKIDLISSKLPTDFAHEASKFKQQHQQAQVEIRRSNDFHDRFIIVDETECWHLGCSIKDAGNKAFVIKRIEDSQNSNAIIRALNNTWKNATIDA